MRKVSALVLTLILVFSLSVPAFAASDAFLYTNDDTGCSFSVPGDWKLEYEGDSILFVPRSGKSVNMRYLWLDAWEELSNSDKKEISRSDYNNDQLSKADAADFVEAKTSDVKIVNLAGTEYFQITKTEKKGFFIFKKTTTVISLIHAENGWVHLFQFEKDSNHALYPAFEEMVASTVYAQSAVPEEATEETVPQTTAETLPPTEPVKTDADIYREAQDAYDEGYYATARKKFESVSSYLDSQKYLRLIRIRSYGENTGIGCVYNFNKALTDSEKEEIDAAAEDFYFADTAQVLLCNTDVACYYLFGNWTTASNSSPYAYFKLHKDSSGGYYYTRSTNLSNAVSDCVSIIDGDVRISITSSNTLVFHIDLTAPDCMEIYSYEHCKRFTLYRK